MHKKHLYVGTVEFELIGGLGERFFNQCAQQSLCVEKIRPTATGFLAQTHLRTYRRLRKIARANKCRIHVVKRKGVSFFFAGYRRHWSIVIGLVLAAALFACGRQLIWNISFVDFSNAEQLEMRKELAGHGIYEGAAVSYTHLIPLRRS